MDVIRFDCHGNNAPAYSCNKPGDNTGDYIRLEDAAAEIERLNRALKKQAASAKSGMDAAKRVSRIQLEEAKRLRAESSPEALESERAANAKLTDEIERLQNLAERLRQEAEVHAQEARTQRATVHIIYQVIGAQKGDWNGAEPVIEAFSKLEQERDQLKAVLTRLVKKMNPADRKYARRIYREHLTDLIDHDAEVIERFAADLSSHMPKFSVNIDLLAKRYINQLRAKAKGVES